MLFKTSTLIHGNMSLRFGNTEEVLKNRRWFLAENNIAWEDHSCMRCNHSSTITAVNRGIKTEKNRMVDAEVLITQEKNFALMLLTADCLPTAFYDPITQTLALAHFSRQTIADELPKRTVAYLQEHFSAASNNLHITVGPYIHTHSYQFPNPPTNIHKNIAPFVDTQQTSATIDLLAAHNTQLIAAGITKENIAASSIDTATSSEHFSHYMHTRHNHPEGRIATIAMMVSEKAVVL